ncbi:MAG: glutaredoxin 3 [Pseudomonadota bacterium]
MMAPFDGNAQAKVEIYYWTTCPFCTRARALLDKKGVDYVGYDITGDDEARAKMIERTGGPKSVPQIFIDDQHIGGCDDIHALDDEGKLDDLLKG